MAIVKSGDLWTIGNHRLLCGDCTNADHVSYLMQNNRATLCFTSPPYGQQRDYTQKIIDWDRLMQGMASHLPLTHDGQLLVNLGLVHRRHEWQPYWDNWIEWLRTEGWRRFGWYVWDKGFGLPGDWHGRLAPAFEFIFHFNKEIRRPNKTIEKKPENIKNRATSILRHRNNKIKPVYAKGHESEHTHKIPDSVIRCVRHTGATEHPAVFSVPLCSEIIRAYSNPGDIIYEPFAGSGTQIIAAERDDRICYAMEAAPEYCDIALRKVQKDTGLLAYRQDGTAFDDIGRDPFIKFDALLTI